MERLSPGSIEETIRKNSYGIEIGGKSPQALMAELRQSHISVSDWARDMMESPDFATLGRRTEIEVARLTPADLGFIRYPTTEQFFDRAASFGLELLPAEAGQHARLQDGNQRPGDWYHIAMDPIADRYGGPGVFLLGRGGGGLWLDGRWASPGDHWNLDNAFVFGLRK